MEDTIVRIKKYLKNKNYILESNIIEYVGVREYQLVKGEKKNYHYFNFEVITDKNSKFGVDTYFILVEEETDELAYLLGPHIFKKIEE